MMRRLFLLAAPAAALGSVIGPAPVGMGVSGALQDLERVVVAAVNRPDFCPEAMEQAMRKTVIKRIWANGKLVYGSTDV